MDAPENNIIFYKLFRDADALFIVLDEAFKLDFSNRRAEELLDIKNSHDRGKSISALRHEIDIGPIKEALDSCENKNPIYTVPDIVIDKGEGRFIVVGLKVYKMIPVRGKVYYIIAGQDITRKRQEEASNIMGEKLQALGELASGIAHDLNSPVQFISNNLRYIDSVLADDSLMDIDEVKAAVKESLKGLEQISGLTNALKNYIYSSDPRIESCDIRKLINNAVFITKSRWGKKVGITTDVSDDIKNIYSYPSEIIRVIINLIINSVQALEEAGQQNGLIGIRSFNNEGGIVIEVSDNGPGIPEANRSRIFEPFFTTKPRGVGTGQGLSIARSIVADKCKGRITYHENIPEGSLFKIILPELG